MTPGGSGGRPAGWARAEEPAVEERVFCVWVGGESRLKEREPKKQLEKKNIVSRIGTIQAFEAFFLL